MAFPGEAQQIQLINSFDSNLANNVVQLNLPYPIKLYEYDVALLGIQMYYSWNNITAAYVNNAFSYRWVDGVTYPVNFPDGFYQISDINGFLQFTMEGNGHYLVDNNGNNVYYLSLAENTVYYAITLTSTPVPTVLPAGWTNPNGVPLNGLNPQLIVPATVAPNGLTSMSILIGFNPGTYPPANNVGLYMVNGQNVPDISPVTSVNVNTNLAYSSFFSPNGQAIYNFTANVPFGSLIDIHPNPLVYYRANDSSYPSIQVFLTDQNNNPLNNLDPVIVCSLLLKRRAHVTIGTV